MVKIDLNGIQREAEKTLKTPSVQKEINKIIDEYMLGSVFVSTENGKNNIKPPRDAAKKFIEVLRNQIASHDGFHFGNGDLGATAISALSNLDFGKPKPLGNGTYQIEVWFKGDLSRESLSPDNYKPINNIAALLNSGYNAGHVVYGLWGDHGEIHSLRNRKGSRFIEESINVFMNGYAKEYGVVNIDCDNIYK